MRATAQFRFKLVGSMLALTALMLIGCTQASEVSPSKPLPEFSNRASAEWINSAPLSVEGLRGKVLLVDVWTFECWNCYRSFPWLNSLEASFAQADFQVIGIHSPEFDRERKIKAVRAKAAEFKLKHPIMVDNDMRYWRALDNHYWPAYFLVDRQGRIRYRFVGETHAGSKQATAIESAIRKLLAEPA